MENLSLILFSICIQAAIGTMSFVALGKSFSKEGQFKSAVLTAAALAVIGLLASLMHLGKPLSALNSLAQFSTSWLSREIWFTGVFTGLTILTAIVTVVKPGAKGAVKALALLAAVVGLADVYMMVSIYNFTSVPAWQHGSIYVEFYAAAISMGAVIFLALSGQEAAKVKKTASLAVGAAVIVQVAAMVLYYIQLGTSGNAAAGQSLALLNSMSGIMAVKWLFILLGAGVLLFPMSKGNMNVQAGQAAVEVAATAEGTLSLTFYLGAALVVIGQILGRYLFYVIMVINTVGLS
ncbi:dimethyl sulfoxide reductase anchor subunit family protein [Desulfitobacterium chlororespirans]|uniref:Anaerobic dimethyl sulfoxide reductase subunit C (DMSO reductase anchor subunit) n=1 Tax=Desulfitobacterium chlororespirans DSM 11544 TaxID=1121395 RepID=A0A1M7TYR5_9FIRM|nr:DmsC/YnfH family molybdoenzyme membrane anchor subunit [Desulfitobacterium chlororespirans]SHN75825.1 anaerobic dimethyl sulfoxide reductase subunit C (DMSO reductase anchor subunit) [Desulfitobacterium chlororespirans DSM 11544]